MAEIKPIPKIEPLCVDLYKIIGPKFLLSTAFKRWLIEVNLREAWDDFLDFAERSNRGFVFYGNKTEACAYDSLVLIFNDYYKRHDFGELVNFVKGILMVFVEDKKRAVEISVIKKDMVVVGIGTELINTIDDVNASIDHNDMTQSANQTSNNTEAKIRSLEEKYKTEVGKDANSIAAIDAYLKWHSMTLSYLSQYYSNINPDYKEFKNVDNSGNGYVLLNNFHKIYSIYNLLMTQAKNGVKHVVKSQKTPMIFISHSSKDKDFVESLVELLESLGFDEKTLFCSSVDGYGIGLGDNVFNTLKNLFLEHDLYVLFIHSPRYYESTVSLNEMGAAWVLKTNYFSFLTKDMSFSRMTGVVNSSEIAIKVDADDAYARLNELKDKLLEAFGLEGMSQTKWERKRDKFLLNVLKIK